MWTQAHMQRDLPRREHRVKVSIRPRREAKSRPPRSALRSNAFISDFQPPQLCDNEFLGFFLCLHAILFTSISFSVNDREEIGHSIFLIRMEGKMAMKKKMGLFPR